MLVMAYQINAKYLLQLLLFCSIVEG